MFILNSFNVSMCRTYLYICVLDLSVTSCIMSPLGLLVTQDQTYIHTYYILVTLCSVVKELVCVVLTAILGMPGGVLLFLPLYHPLHDLAGIHSEVTFFILFTVFLLICWTADRTPSPDARPRAGTQFSVSMTQLIHACFVCWFGALYQSLT